MGKLPHIISNIPYYVLFDAEGKSGRVELKADATKLRLWLEWLKEHNQYYRHIEIDADVLSTIAEVDDVADVIQQTEVRNDNNGFNDEGKYSSFVPKDVNFNQEKIIRKKLHLPYPEIGSRPINEFNEVGNNFNTERVI